MAYDVVIIGAGLAGMTAALKAIEMGKKTIVVSYGASTMEVMSGCIDLYGDDINPWPALSELALNNPAHPYALLSRGEIQEALSFFVGQIKESYPYHYQKGFTNFRIPTAFGEERSTCLLPEGQFAGQSAVADAKSRVLVVGLKGYPDFAAELLVEGMQQRGFQGWEKTEIDLDCLQMPAERGEYVKRAGAAGRSRWQRGLSANSVEIAKRLEKGWQQLAAELGGMVQGFDAVAFPAVLGLNEHLLVKRGLEEYLGVRVFEIPTIHPSLPGMRLARSLAAELCESEGDSLQGFPVVSADIQERQCGSIIVNTPGRPRCIRGKNFILATGGVLGGGILVERKGAKEVVFRLPVANPAAEPYLRTDADSTQVTDLTAAPTAASVAPHIPATAHTTTLDANGNEERSGMLGDRREADYLRFLTSISQDASLEDEIRGLDLHIKEPTEADLTQPPANPRHQALIFPRVGVRVNKQLQPVDEDGGVLLENVFCAGRILAGYDPFIEGSGAGVAIATGYKAAVEAGRVGNAQ